MAESMNLGRTSGDGMEDETITGLSTSIEQYSSTASAGPSTSLLVDGIKNLIPSSSSSNCSSINNNNTIITSSINVNNKPPISLGQNLIYRETYSNPSLPAYPPKGKIFNLIPRLIVSNKTEFSLQHKNREPKFVPFEPYKAAVNPMLPDLKPHKIKVNKKNNLDLNTLVSHMSHMKTRSNNGNIDERNKLSVTLEELSELDRQRIKYEKQLDDLRKDRDCVGAQLKSQVQVNAELKNLLVAAVGEDLQTRVNVLTEDKLQLARALLSTAENLSSHTEQIEYLAGQSEVWRSKFLASSLMVEELARWKASLTQKNKHLLDANREMLQTMSTIRDLEIQSLTNLKFLSQQRSLNIPTSNVLDVTAECLNITQQLILQTGIGMPAQLDLTGLDTTTPAEKSSIQALQCSNEPLMSTDEAFRAIVGQAFPAATTRRITPTLPSLSSDSQLLVERSE